MKTQFSCTNLHTISGLIVGPAREIVNEKYQRRIGVLIKSKTTELYAWKAFLKKVCLRKKDVAPVYVIRNLNIFFSL